AARRSAADGLESLCHLRVAQIHMERRAPSSVLHARCAGRLALRAAAKSIHRKVIFRSRSSFLASHT
ncbi:hypothetical protein A2U01_0107291, partial [Trifolium medium]|nr:hypothetical protein [Trifolium medium]